MDTFTTNVRISIDHSRVSELILYLAVVMRYKECMEQLSYIKEASALGNLELVYASMDVLSSTPWRINRDVFDVVLQVWNSGQRLGKLPPAEFDEPEPERPEHYDSDPKARTIYLMRQKQYINAKANNHSDRCNVNYKIEIARTVSTDLSVRIACVC